MKRILGALASAALVVSVSTPALSNTVEMRVGQTKHITAYRADKCGAGAPTFNQIKSRLPRSSIVEYSDGGTSSRVSDQCKTRVPTRAVNGKAVKTGKETRRYQSGSVTIVVK